MSNNKQKESDKQKEFGLMSLIDRSEKKRLERDVYEIKKPKLETEKVLNAESPEIVFEIIRHVNDCKTQFVTPDHPDISPKLPKGIAAQIQVPTETTPLRERPYFIDADGYLREIDCDARQEYKNGMYKQTIKVGKGGTKYDSTMDRMEQPSLVLSFGFNIFAVGDEVVQQDILRNVTSLIKPGLRMLSQRTRIPYHPEGNSSLLIEMALEPIHVGETFTGFVWQRPKIDLEIKMGPTDTALRHAILAREEARLMSLFPLTRQLESSPTLGFQEITESMRNPAVRAQFDQLGVSQKWWNESKLAHDLAA